MEEVGIRRLTGFGVMPGSLLHTLARFAQLAAFFCVEFIIKCFPSCILAVSVFTP